MACSTKSKNVNGVKQKKPACYMIPARIALTILVFFGIFNLYSSTVSLSVAIVAMVGKPQPEAKLNGTSIACPNLLPFKYLTNESKFLVKGEFEWDILVQSRVLGAFYYGYLVTQIPGGILAQKYGAKWIFGSAVFITALLSLLIPTAARWNAWALFTLRLLQGLAGGLAFPAMNSLIGRWAPKSERSRISSFMIMGCQIGIFTTNASAGVLCESTFLGGWPSVFYICGIIGCIWFIFWVSLVHENPENHPRISEKELNFIKEGQDTAPSGKIKVPWKSIWTSIPVWAVIIAHFGFAWVFYTTLTMMPTYFSNILHFDLKENGIVSGLPNLMMALFSIPASIAADTLRTSGRLQVTSIRKMMNSISFYGLGVCFLAIAFAGCYQILIIALFVISFSLNGFLYSGFEVTHVDMSPQFAGILFGITNCIATLSGFLAPAFVGGILNGGETVINWRIIFIVTSCVYFLTGTFYNIFASAELQPWNQKQETKMIGKVSIQTMISSYRDLNEHD